jgi:hypothetical protein
MNGFNLVKEIGRSFIISAFIPAALFVSVIGLLFIGFVPPGVLAQLEKIESLFVIFGTSFAIVTLWISLLLYSSVDWVISVFAGYHFPEFLNRISQYFLLRNLGRRTSSLKYIRRILNKSIDERTAADQEHYRSVWPHVLAELNQTGWVIPSEDYLVMPTRLGNILSASSEYALDRYRIEMNQIWPRLRELLPEKFLKSMEEKNNHLVFTLNSALLINIVGLICLVAAILGLSFQSFQIMPLRQNGFVSISPVTYLLVSLTMLMIGYSLYRVAINTALEFISFYRTGVDLYRLELLKKLNYAPPKNLREEQNFWLEISSFFIAGEKLAWDPDTYGTHPYYYEGAEKPSGARDGGNKEIWLRALFVSLLMVLHGMYRSFQNTKKH